MKLLKYSAISLYMFIVEYTRFSHAYPCQMHLSLLEVNKYKKIPLAHGLMYHSVSSCFGLKVF